MPQAKHLFLLRHAKSSWEDPGLDDHERPLAPRGRRAAMAMAGHLARAGVEPELVLCSTARRARETLERLSPGGEVLIESELYGASPTQLIERLRRVPDAVDSVMLIGHNPAMQSLAISLAVAGGERERVERKFPTGALATLVFHGGWGELQPGSAELVAFVRPKEIG
ncbi:MAG TPA: histidine phosphatase family protein [Solirubrobacteraceae bacterium]|jgi:phosphohistidine phosphatase|nr:histidine phosphatase family protein [Solirubrobacteraceae bacterium]